MTLAAMVAIYAETRKRPEKLRPQRDSNPDLCDADVVLFQLSNQAHWKLAILWVHSRYV